MSPLLPCQDSNLEPPDPESGALPIELQGRVCVLRNTWYYGMGGRAHLPEYNTVRPIASCATTCNFSCVNASAPLRFRFTRIFNHIVSHDKS